TEVGLLALVMTPIILTGGGGLSVGSLLGPCALVFGQLSRHAGRPPRAAAGGAVGGRALGGGPTAPVVPALRVPTRVVALGAFSVFRGIAETIPRGVDNFPTLPSSFLFLGQGYLFGVVPAQLPLFGVVAVVLWFLVHRTVYGRAFQAIGFSPKAA